MRRRADSMATRVVGMVVLLMATTSCGGGGGSEETQAPSTSSGAVPTTSTTAPTATSASTGPTTTTTRITIPTTLAAPAAGTPVDANLVPEKDQLYVTFGKATINGKDYTNALVVEPFGNRTSRLEIDAGRRRVRFLGDLGIPDSQRSSTAYKVDISFDQGGPAFSTEVRFGETKKIDLDVTGVLRIKVVLTPLTSSSSSCCGTIAIGEPLLR